MVEDSDAHGKAELGMHEAGLVVVEFLEDVVCGADAIVLVDYSGFVDLVFGFGSVTHF